jgi:ABC-type sugar transport system ATPase subunit
MAAIRIEAVHKRFGDVAVINGVDLTVGDGELVVFVGPSGCGKTTLLRLIAGLESLTAGEIHIGDRQVNDVPPRDRNIAMVFQNYALYPHMSVAKNIDFGLKLRGMKKPEREAAVKRVAALLGLEGFLDRKPRELSGGQRQRVAMGRCIVRDPAVFLMDEPLSNLDAKLRNHMRVEIKQLQRDLEKTMIYVTHDQVEAMTLADRIMVLEAGHVSQIGTPDDLYARPANIFVAGFIGTPAMNFIPARRVGEGVLELPDGIRMTLPPDRAAALTSDTDLVDVGIRPEHLKLMPAHEPVHEPAHKHDEGAVQWHSSVALCEPLGGETLLHLTLGDLRLRARVTRAETVRENTRAYAAFHAADAHVFDSGTGQCLSHAANH